MSKQGLIAELEALYEGMRTMTQEELKQLIERENRIIEQLDERGAYGWAMSVADRWN